VLRGPEAVKTLETRPGLGLGLGAALDKTPPVEGLSSSLGTSCCSIQHMDLSPTNTLEWWTLRIGLTSRLEVT